MTLSQNKRKLGDGLERFRDEKR